MQPSIPQDIAVGLPFVAAWLAHWLMADRLAAWKNAAISAAYKLIASQQAQIAQLQAQASAQNSASLQAIQQIIPIVKPFE